MTIKGDLRSADEAADVAALLALEEERCERVNAHDIERFADLLAPDYVHVHATGQVDERERSIEGFRSIPRRMWRGDLHVRVSGDIGIIVGRQFNILQIPGKGPFEVTLRVSQVARRMPEGWRFIHFHANKIGEIM